MKKAPLVFLAKGVFVFSPDGFRTPSVLIQGESGTDKEWVAWAKCSGFLYGPSGCGSLLAFQGYGPYFGLCSVKLDLIQRRKYGKKESESR